jgi:hypothetical protein
MKHLVNRMSDTQLVVKGSMQGNICADCVIASTAIPHVYVTF